MARRKKLSLGSRIMLWIIKLPFKIAYGILWLIIMGPISLRSKPQEPQEPHIPEPRKKSCPACGGRKLSRVQDVVESNFHGVKTVPERYEWKLTKPAGPVVARMSMKQFIKLSLFLSLFFTPFLGPFMAWMVKILYDGSIDPKATKARVQEWARQGFCFKCGLIWTEELDFA
jgi:hypothetical protein